MQTSKRDPNEKATSEREAMIRALRERYLNGTIEEALFPEDPNIDQLLEDLLTPEAEPVLHKIPLQREAQEEIA